MTLYMIEQVVRSESLAIAFVLDSKTSRCTKLYQNFSISRMCDRQTDGRTEKRENDSEAISRILHDVVYICTSLICPCTANDVDHKNITNVRYLKSNPIHGTRARSLKTKALLRLILSVHCN